MEYDPDSETKGLTRRRFLQTSAMLGAMTGWPALMPSHARPANGTPHVIQVRDGEIAELVIARTPLMIGSREGSAITLNGTVPGPLLRFREGDTVTLKVTNRLDEDTSIHWHGVLVPQEMDGVPGVSFPGIRPGENFTYRYSLRQNGTYWYHSHSGVQLQAGHYAPLIIEPAGKDPVAYDREYIVMLSDWTFENPHRVVARLKKQNDYYNFQQRTIGDFFRDAAQNGLRGTLRERAMWGRMRMSPTDIADVTGYTYTYLINGFAPEDNWTALFRPGERVRLRFIDAGMATFFNVRIPGLAMTVVQSDGQNVQPVTIDEFQMAPGETYDVIVEPQDHRAYTVFAESMDRSGYGRATLASQPGMSAPIPPLRKRPLRTMIDMGMDMNAMSMAHKGGGEAAKPQMKSNEHGGHGSAALMSASPPPAAEGMSKDKHAGMAMQDMERAGPIVARHGPDTHGSGNASVAQVQRNRLGERGTGLESVAHRVLVYTDLQCLEPNRDPRPPAREIELHLTGNMENFMWGFDGKKFSQAKEPIPLEYGERLRITLVNDTMMEHPMHLHGMFKEIDTGVDRVQRPRKHTISVKPAERLSFELTVDEPGNWVFHCHLNYHMELGMLRIVNVPRPAKEVRS